MSLYPNWASPPGETIARLQTRAGLTKDQLKNALGLEDGTMRALVCGNLRISAPLAERLADTLGSNPRFWLMRDAQFREDRDRLAKKEDQSEFREWAKQFNMSSLKNLELIPSSSRPFQAAVDLLSFFGCGSLAEWKNKYNGGIGAVAFRTSFAFEADDMATLAWLRAGELQLDEVKAGFFDREGFVGSLPELKKLSALKHPSVFFPRLQAMCAKHGVKVVSHRAPNGCRASGASWISDSGNPVIMLSFRHLSDDHFWFTFFHEAAHVVLHGGSHIDVDGGDPSPLMDSRAEAEADSLAQSVLVPTELEDELRSLTANRTRIIRFARKCGVTAGIVVGQLQKRRIIRHEQMNFLKRRFRWNNNFRFPDST